MDSLRNKPEGQKGRRTDRSGAHGELWEDIQDQRIAEERAGDKREPYAAVRKRLVRAGKLRG